jgi:hypothetical protein
MKRSGWEDAGVFGVCTPSDAVGSDRLSPYITPTAVRERVGELGTVLRTM